MTIAGQSNIAAARTTFETLVDNALESQRSAGHWQALARRVEGGDSNAYQAIVNGATPTWQKQDGTRSFGGFRKLTKTIYNDTYYKSLKLARKDVIYDKGGSTAQALKNFVTMNGDAYDKLVFDCLASNEVCADGVALISTTHPFGKDGATWSNSTSGALDKTEFDGARAAVAKLTDEFGEPLELNADTLIVHPDEARTALELAEADVSVVETTNGATNITNVFKGLVTVIVTPRMKSGDWVVVDSRFPPITLVEWRSPEPHVADDMSNPERMINDQFLYVIEGDLGAGAVQPYGVFGKIS